MQPLISLAAPTGGNITGGSGAINQSGSTTNIYQNSNTLSINWNSFNVNSNETVNFLQPGASSIALNRILSNNPSQIFGQINANGQVVLVNPNGIFFGNTSAVNVGGLIASGLDISPADFMNGDYIFNEVLGTDGSIINSGLISASLGGNVALIGKQVSNEGVINAQLGSVALASGKEAVLTFDTDGLIGVRVSKAILQDDIGVDPALINSGEITAEGGQVLLTASVSQDVFSQAVNSGSIEQATSVVVNEDGTFTLGAGADVINTGAINASSKGVIHDAGQVIVLGENVTSSGSIQSNSDTSNAGSIEIHAKDKTVLEKNSDTSATSHSNDGGAIKVLGNKVGLFDQSIVDVSGALDGGRVLIGGDFQGKNPGIRNASISYVGKDATIKANSLSKGKGGNVIVWSDDTTRFYGSIFAKGGLLSGDGGFAEVSGKEYLGFTGGVNLFSGLGKTGTLLLDPQNITIEDGGADPITATYAGDPVTATYAFTVDANTYSSFDADLITDILTGGNGMTQASVVLEARGDIWVKETIDISTHTGNTQSLTLKAGDDIEIDAPIKLAGGKLTISQGDSGCDPNCINLGTLIADDGSVLDINNDLSTAGGDIILGNTDFYGDPDIIKIGSSDKTTINISTGASSSGNITFNDQVYDDDHDENINNDNNDNNNNNSSHAILNLEAGNGIVSFANVAGTLGDYFSKLNISSASEANLNEVNTTSGGIEITANDINLHGDLRSDRGSNGGDVSLTGNIVLTNNDVRIDTTQGSDGKITVTGTIDDDADVDNFYRLLELRSGGKDVEIS